MIRIGLVIFVALVISGTSAFAQNKSGSLLLQKNFNDLPGREGVMLTVEYPPGASSPCRFTKNTKAFAGSVLLAFMETV